MKKKFVGSVLFCFLILITAVSCATTPPPEDQDASAGRQVEVSPQPAGQEPLTGQAALDALNAAVARAAEARSRASDFNGQALFPSEWDSAQTLFDQAEQQRNTSNDQSIQDSTARYNRAADAFDALFDRSIVEFFSHAERDLAAARDAAVAAGARELTPDFLADADSTAARATREYEARNYDTARNSTLDALAMYNAIRTVLEAHRLRGEISNRGFEGYDPANINSGDAAYDAAMAALNNRNIAEASGRADEALSRFGTALRTAWQTLAEQGRAAASAERQRALDVRANVAAREEFDPAETIYNRANTSLSREVFEEAAGFYNDCRLMFISSTQLAMTRRQAAQDALDRADRRLIESEQTAMAVEQILEGGVE